MNFSSLLEEIIFFFSFVPWIIRLAIGFIVFNLLVFLALFFSTYFLIRKKKRQEAHYLAYEKAYKDAIHKVLANANVLSASSILDRFETQFGRLTSVKYEEINNALIDLVTADPKLYSCNNYTPLIDGLKIKKYLERKLDFSKTANRLKAMKQLSSLKITVSDSKILPFTFSKNTPIRKGARTAYVVISNNNPFKFFELSDNQMNEWDQINLLQQLELHHKGNLPNFSNWIKYSKDPSQIIFSVRAIAHFRQQGATEGLLQLLATDNHMIREEVIRAMASLRITDGEDKLKEIYSSQPRKCQVAIIEALAQIYSMRSLDFFVDTLRITTNAELKKVLLEAIYSYGIAGREVFNNLLLTAKDFDLIILNHIKHPLNKSKFSDLNNRLSPGKEVFDYAPLEQPSPLSLL
ncbi:HEAT repeat domain-containing protein [Sphingobacteriaceae bacterium WQ 2009]|uniref:HEAT repeat domain-containing protein n=1 Tax=Rhinopithecimicrobium faecis TaxID=2820698 RepID=A0A8T4HBD9_9SPHI|nr:HEAT repeat domain-containing protein [Sphingobacteriaceae bacterium WQ 2009]